MKTALSFAREPGIWSVVALVFAAAASVLWPPNFLIHVLFIYVCFGFAIFTFFSVLKTRDQRGARAELARMNELMGHIPQRIDALGIDEVNHTRLLSILKTNGELAQVSVPLDYDPRLDNGELLLRAMVGDEAFDGLTGEMDMLRTILVNHPDVNGPDFD